MARAKQYSHVPSPTPKLTLLRTRRPPKRLLTLNHTEPKRAAEHFFCLLKGLVYMRVLMALCAPPEKQQRDSHVREVVTRALAD